MEEGLDMANHILDLKKNVADLVEEFPELRQVLADIGFKEILSDKALHVMGRIMTIPRGAAVKGIAMDRVKAALQAAGFAFAEESADKRKALLKEYLERLHRGEPLESVQKEFRAHFIGVAPEEIAAAEQALIRDGAAPKEVQRLCSVHAALFTGNTKEEKPAVTEDTLPAGHPLTLLRLENEKLSELLDRIEAETAGENMAKLMPLLGRLFAIYAHYAKKEELLMPFLYDYGVTGPSQVMWGVDDEIKRELGTVMKSLKEDTENFMTYRGRLNTLIESIREMIIKEDRILFPLALRFFTENEWKMVYADCFEMGMAFVDEETLPRWETGERYRETLKLPENVLTSKVKMPAGEVSVRALIEILKLIDIDITYIDKDDNLRFFMNEGKIFSRPLSALGREVYSCHSPSIEPVVRQLLLDFKAKKRRSMEVYRSIKERPVSVRYMGIYDENDEYAGTVEFVQDCSEILNHFKRG